MNKTAPINATFRVIVLLAVVVLMLFPAVLSFAGKPPAPGKQPAENSSPQQPDTLQPIPVNKRLEDPSYDTRFGRGTLRPWHDNKSVYPLRTIPNSSLAVIRKNTLTAVYS
ncbi:MAG: hypothetical protein ACOC12_00800 [Bacteroidota bacterium]